MANLLSSPVRRMVYPGMYNSGMGLGGLGPMPTN